MIQLHDMITGVVLAGGQGSRFGSNVAFARYRQVSFIDRAVSLLQPFCSQILISGSPEAYRNYPYEVCPDLFQDKGALAGIHATLLIALNPYVLYVACDMPLIDGALLVKQIHRAGMASGVAWCQPDGFVQPFPLMLNREVLPVVIHTLEEERKPDMELFFQRIPVETIPLTSDELSRFRNINYREELDHLMPRVNSKIIQI